MLHKAAKQVLLLARDVMLPEVTVSSVFRLPDGRHGGATARREAWLQHYEDPRPEVDFGSVQPDVVIETDLGPIWIEIVVTNPVSSDKLVKLKALGVPVLELKLGLPHFAGQSAWGLLRQAVLYEKTTRKWLIEPRIPELEAEAERLSKEEAERRKLPFPPDLTAEHERCPANPEPAPPSKNNYHCGRTVVILRQLKFGVSVAAQTSDFALDPYVTRQLALWGGRYSEKHKNWIFPADKEARLRDALTRLEKKIAQQSAQEIHKRVLDAYYAEQAD
ncbi:hypothetical protein [Azonexus sp. R2A61]|uniref:hypothetical protein n=1 Tax=Azonexus sp. R2A61 TaxID=2744443 RepID=UPI001F37A2F1|nr:hypothetical protein [Azonexus sp. R2A61]